MNLSSQRLVAGPAFCNTDHHPVFHPLTSATHKKKLMLKMFVITLMKWKMDKENNLASNDGFNCCCYWLTGLLEHLIKSYRFLESTSQVHHRNIRNWNTECHTSEFAIEFRNHLSHSLSGSSCCRNHILVSPTAITPFLHILERLHHYTRNNKISKTFKEHGTKNTNQHIFIIIIIISIYQISG